MGIFDKVEAEISRTKKKVKKEAKRRTSDFTKLATLGAVDPQEFSRLKREEAQARGEAIKLQTKQKRGALLDQAEIQDEIAQRVATKKRGKRFGLLINSQSGSLLT
jgi:hypothetical protein